MIKILESYVFQREISLYILSQNILFNQNQSNTIHSTDLSISMSLISCAWLVGNFININCSKKKTCKKESWKKRKNIQFKFHKMNLSFLILISSFPVILGNVFCFIQHKLSTLPLTNHQFNYVILPFAEYTLAWLNPQLVRFPITPPRSDTFFWNKSSFK